MKKYTKKKKTLITAGLFACFGLVSILGLSTTKEYKSAQAVNTYTENVIYNDEFYQITFNNNELSNYTFENLANYLAHDIPTSNDLQNTTIYLMAFNYEFEEDIQYDDYDEDCLSYSVFWSTEQELYYVSFYFNDFGDYQAYHWYFYTIDQTFEWNDISNENFVWYLNANIYQDIKNAIELDIQANTPSEGDRIITAVSSGLGLIPDLAQEFLKGFSTLFWDTTNSKLSNAGEFMLVFLGIAICFAIVKLILNILRNDTGA